MKKGTLIAVGVFAVLLTVALATQDRGNVNVGVPKLELPSIDKSKVSSIEVSGAASALLKKEGGAWQVVDPARPGAAHPADEGQIQSLLQNLADLRATDFVTEKAERLAELDIDAAKGLEVKVQSEGGQGVELVFGKASKSGGAYLRSPRGNQVFVTPSTFPWMLRRAAKEWRKRAFFPATFADLTRVTVTHADGQVLPLELGTDAGWALAASAQLPAAYRFDPDAARQVAATLGSVSAADFLEDPLSDEALGFAGPHTTVKAELKDGKALTLHLGREPALTEADGGAKPSTGMVAARLEGDAQVYLLPAHQAAALRKKVGDLRLTTLLAFDDAKATRVEVLAAGKKTVVAKEAGVWKVVEPKALPAGYEFDPGQVAAQLGALKTFRAARVEEVAAGAQTGLAKPDTYVQVTLDGAPAQTLAFGAVAPNADGQAQVFVKGSIDALTYSVPLPQRARWETGLELFKKPPPAPDFGQGQMRGIENLPPDIRRQIEEQMRQRR